MFPLLMAGLVSVAGSPAEADAPDSRAVSLRATLTQAGYTAVPMLRGRVTGWWFVRLEVQGKPTTLLLDTGAAYFGAFSLKSAKRFGLDPHGPVEFGTMPSLTNVPCYHDVYVTARLGSMTRLVPFEVLDNDGLHTPVPGEGIGDYAGLLGTAFLSHHSAVIDYPTGTLFLLDPLRREPGLAGEWEAVSVLAKGRTERVPPGQRRLTIGGGVRHVWPGDTFSGSFTLDLAPGVRAMRWHRRYTDARRPGGTTDRFLYRVAGDELVLCGPVYQRRHADGFPLVRIDGSAASPWDVVTFRRVPEQAPAPRPAP